MTDDELKAIESRVQDANRGLYDPGAHQRAIYFFGCYRTDIPRLVAEVKGLRAVNRNPTAFPTAMDYAESLEKELRAAREALRAAKDWIQVSLENVEAFECRSDEDCDHCCGESALVQIRKALGEE